MSFSWLRRPTKYRASSGRNGAPPVGNRLRMVLGALLVANAVLLVLVFSPPGRTLSEREQELERTRARHEELSKTGQQLRELRGKLQAAIHNGQQFTEQNFLAKKTAFSAMLADLEEVALQNQVKPSSISYGLNEESDYPGWVNVEVTMTVAGEYSNLVRFINRLEQSPLFWIIDSLTVSGSPERGLHLNLNMETYIVP